MIDHLRMVVVPRDLQRQIAAKIEEAEKRDGIEIDLESRSSIQNQLLCFYAENGYLPELLCESE